MCDNNRSYHITSKSKIFFGFWGCRLHCTAQDALKFTVQLGLVFWDILYFSMSSNEITVLHHHVWLGNIFDNILILNKKNERWWIFIVNVTHMSILCLTYDTQRDCSQRQPIRPEPAQSTQFTVVLLLSTVKRISLCFVSEIEFVKYCTSAGLKFLFYLK